MRASMMLASFGETHFRPTAGHVRWSSSNERSRTRYERHRDGPRRQC